MAAIDVGSAGLKPRYIPVSQLPTTSLQQGAMAIIFLMTFLAFAFWIVRMYSRLSTKQLGIVQLTERWRVRRLACYGRNAVLDRNAWAQLPLYVHSYTADDDVQALNNTDFKYEFIGFPSDNLPDTYDPQPSRFWNWIMQVLYNPILALVKSSVLIFLLRLGGHKRSIRWSIYALNTFNILQMIAIFFTVILQTIPIRAYWDMSIKKQREIDSPLFYVSTAIITIITDILVLVIPFWVFIGLKMRLAAKLGLIVVFLMGGVVTIVAIVRVHEFRKKYYNLDPGYDARNSLGDTLSTVEVNLAIIACCGPALRPLFRRMFPGLFSSNNSNGATYNTSARYGNTTGLRQTAANAAFPLKDIHLGKTHTEIRGHSPNGSEEEIMTYNGIIRTTAMSNNNDPEASQQSTEQTPLLGDQPPHAEDGRSEPELEPESEPTPEKRSHSWYAWRIFWAILAAIVIGVFVKGWIDADETEFDLKGALKRALGGGLSGAAAMVLQVLLLMPLRTIMNYQYRHGTSFTVATKTLYEEGGVRRYYQGIAPALIQGPVSRFGDTAANAGILALLQSNPYLKNLPSPIKTVFASLCAAAFRMILTPIDTLKTTLQAQGARGTALLRRRIKSNGIGSLWWGAFATAAATFVGHYPWFATYNYLSETITEPPKHPLFWWLLRLAFIGFCASVVSDSISNSLRVVKTYRQVNDTKVSYAEAARAVVVQDGVIGLLGRGLKTRILCNGLQGIIFSILWKLFLDLWEKNTSS
ncbi:hypothetical protein FDECE_4494 [Fusarium decemcellulare]|nr:hypothetical protein FDECE_4494 [Fusarium decemcellulare]